MHLLFIFCIYDMRKVHVPHGSLNTMLFSSSGVSNSFSATGHIYIPGFYTGQTLLKKILTGKTVHQWSPNFFVCLHRKPVDQISRHTSHANLFLLMASGIIWKSPVLLATISGNRVMQLKMVLISKKRSLPLFLPVMPPATYSSCRPLFHGSIFSILAKNLHQ